MSSYPGEQDTVRLAEHPLAQRQTFQHRDQTGSDL